MNQLTTVDDKPKRQLIEVVDPIPVLDTSRFEHMQRIANVMAQSTLIPESLYKEKDKELPLSQIISNCFLVVNQSVRWGLDPFAVAQSVAVVRGKLCYEGKLIAAVLDAKLSVRLHAAFTGDPSKPDYRIFLSDIPWTEELIAQLRPGFAAPGMRIVDGSVSEWQTGEKSPWAAVKNYRRMLIYRGTRDWARFYEPAVLLGVYTPDEMMDLADNARAERAREIADRPSIAERLATARIEQQEPEEQREGFDADFVARETDGLSAGTGADEEHLSEQDHTTETETGSGDRTADPDETGAEQTEAGNGSAASSAPVDPARTELRRECIDKFIEIATRHDLPDPKDRRGVLETAKNAWKQSAPHDLDIVKAAFETADKIIKGELPADAARRYLEGLL